MARVEGFKRSVPQELMDRVWDLVAAGMGIKSIAIECEISEDKARSIARLKDVGWAQNIAEGGRAKPGTICPYGMAEIGLRNAWLAGHYDKHGREAWERARQ